MDKYAEQGMAPKPENYIYDWTSFWVGLPSYS